MKLWTQFGSRKFTTEEERLGLSLDNDHKTIVDATVREEPIPGTAGSTFAKSARNIVGSGANVIHSVEGI